MINLKDNVMAYAILVFFTVVGLVSLAAFMSYHPNGKSNGPLFQINELQRSVISSDDDSELYEATYEIRQLTNKNLTEEYYFLIKNVALDEPFYVRDDLKPSVFVKETDTSYLGLSTDYQDYVVSDLSDIPKSVITPLKSEPTTFKLTFKYKDDLESASKYLKSKELHKELSEDIGTYAKNKIEIVDLVNSEK